jgi:hypothetical protein
MDDQNEMMTKSMFTESIEHLARLVNTGFMEMEKVMARKDDLASMARKDDIVPLARKDDLVSLARKVDLIPLAGKDDLVPLRNDMALLREIVLDLAHRVDGIEKELRGMHQNFDAIFIELREIRNQINEIDTRADVVDLEIRVAKIEKTLAKQNRR